VEPDLGVPRLASVSVEEGRDGIVITVATTSGERVRQPAASTEGGVESAVVRATARLALPEAPDATVVDIEDRRVEGADIVMIVLDVDGRLHAGSAVVAAGRAFALGRATWAALTL
jgi:F420-0:gamma-glutamyl ligase-like protein